MMASGQHEVAPDCQVILRFPRIALCFSLERMLPSTGRTSLAPERSEQTATNSIENERERSKINEADRYLAAHNGPVAALA